MYATYPKNFAPTGPNSRMRLANASPSIRGGGLVNLSLLKYLHVTRIGIAAFRGGTITRTPLCLHPRIAPPLASTKKETRKLKRFRECVIWINDMLSRTIKKKVIGSTYIYIDCIQKVKTYPFAYSKYIFTKTHKCNLASLKIYNLILSYVIKNRIHYTM